MRHATALLAVAAVAACSAGQRAVAPPAAAPRPGVAPLPAEAAPLRYRLLAPLVYEIARHDSLFFDSTEAGAAQASDKTGLLLVRPLPGQEGEQVEVVLQSLAAGPGSRLSVASLDSAAGTRWQLTLGEVGPKRFPAKGSPSELAEQMGAFVRLLFPQLPSVGLKSGDVWSDSTSYPIREDAFDAVESAVRTSTAGPVANGVRVEAMERIRRKGAAQQGGQAMSLAGGGARWLTYDLVAPGVVAVLSARDSLELRVRVESTGQIIPVRWRSTLTARRRGATPR